MQQAKGAIVNRCDGNAISIETAPYNEILYVNKLAMLLVDAADLGFTSAGSKSLMGSKTEIDAKMRSASRVRLAATALP